MLVTGRLTGGGFVGWQKKRKKRKKKKKKEASSESHGDGFVGLQFHDSFHDQTAPSRPLLPPLGTAGTGGSSTGGQRFARHTTTNYQRQGNGIVG